MNQNAYSDSEGDGHQQGGGGLWTSESSQGPTSRCSARASIDYNAPLSLPFMGSMSSSSDWGYGQWTPQDSLPSERIPVERLGLGGSEEASNLSLSTNTGLLHPSAVSEAPCYGIELFEPPSSQSTGFTGQVLYSRDHEKGNFADGVVELGSWEYDNQVLPEDRRCDPMDFGGDQGVPGEPMPLLGGYQEQSVGVIRSGIFSEGYQNIEHHDEFEATATNVPRYVSYGSSTSAPWSAYSVSEDRICRIPRSDEFLFVAEQVIPSNMPHLEHIAQQTGSTTKKRKKDSKPPADNHKAGTNLPDRVGSPPSGNPVGPPPNIFETPHAMNVPQHGTMMQRHRIGGRHGGLNPRCREAAGKMRQIRSCWHCALIRGTCRPVGTGTDCQACITSICDRTYLPELSKIFLPASLLDQHRVDAIKDFCRTRVCEWTDNRLTVHVTWGYGRPIICDVNEFKPQGDSLLYQNQYKRDLGTGGLYLVRTPSPPLGMILIKIRHCRSQLLEYLDKFLEEQFEGFPQACYRGVDYEVQRDLLYILHRYHIVTANVLLRLCLKLIVLTEIMTHTMTLVEDKKEEVFSSLWNRPTEAFGVQTSPRWLNKQLKFLFSSLHMTLMETILGKLTQTLRGSKKASSWASNFAIIMMLAMANESVQITLRHKESTDKEEGMIDLHDETAKRESVLIDEKFDFLQDLYHKSYKTQGAKAKGKPSFNPIHNVTDRRKLDAPASQLAQSVGDLVESHRDFLKLRQGLDVPTATEPNTSRLVARFLLSF